MVVDLAGVLGDIVMKAVVAEILELYDNEAPLMRAKRSERPRPCDCRLSDGRTFPRWRHVYFDYSSLFPERSEALGNHVSYVENADDIMHYVSVVKDDGYNVYHQVPGLVETDDVPEEEDDPGPVPEGKRVICSVGGVEAVSAGHFDNLPAELLIDSGAVASLVDSRVLVRLGLSEVPLRTYTGSLNGVSGHKLCNGVTRTSGCKPLVNLTDRLSVKRFGYFLTLV
ncbi:hypothetical protein ON010_g13539 [Phytophthora cinnamomi]|nr:hypothetical protein ON010_g13539 [Phytophthora cinnamomi]